MWKFYIIIINFSINLLAIVFSIVGNFNRTVKEWYWRQKNIIPDGVFEIEERKEG